MKAVLVLDRMPKTCAKCPLFDENFDLDCRFLCLPEQKSVSKDKKPDWCPLQEPVIYKDIEKYEKDEYKGGWNDAMYEIGAVTLEQAFPWMKED